MQKVQASLMVANVAILSFFLVGVAVIVHTEAPEADFDLAVDTALAPAEASECRVVRQEEDEAPGAPDAPVARRACEKTCERSVVAPLLFAFLAGGLMNVPEVTSLPCI